MLVLCSNGLSSKKLLDYSARKFSGCKTAALVVTADNVYKENNRNVERCLFELKELGLSAEIFDLDKQQAELLKEYDVVEFIGGNPFYLLNAIKESKAEDVLKFIADKKVLIGWSAAAFVFGPTLELVNRYSPELNYMKQNDMNGISLTCTEVLPHYGSFKKKFERFEEKCREYEKEKDIHVIRINDGDGVFIDGTKKIIVRKSVVDNLILGFK